jgi:hypothetical protein
MTRLFPNEKFQLPPKRLIGNKFDPEFIESRLVIHWTRVLAHQTAAVEQLQL